MHVKYCGCGQFQNSIITVETFLQLANDRNNFVNAVLLILIFKPLTILISNGKSLVLTEAYKRSLNFEHSRSIRDHKKHHFKEGVVRNAGKSLVLSKAYKRSRNSWYYAKLQSILVVFITSVEWCYILIVHNPFSIFLLKFWKDLHFLIKMLCSLHSLDVERQEANRISNPIL